LLFKEVHLKNFLNKYLDFLLNFEKSDGNESETLSKEILYELEKLEFQIHKAEMNYVAREKDLNYHKHLVDTIESSITQTQDEIEELKQEFGVREKKKRAKYEYEIISSEINKYENPEIMNGKLGKIQKEIDELKTKHDDQMAKIQLKEKQLYQLIYSVNEFQDILVQEDTEKKKD